MRQSVAIFFLAVFLFSATEAYQLLKLPIIFQHFREHKEEDRRITFLAFLEMHYMHGSPRDADYDRDMQLPFKTSGELASFIHHAFLPLAEQLFIVRPAEVCKAHEFGIQDKSMLSSYLSNIWQPPRTC